MTVFTSGVYAEVIIQEVQAFLRPDYKVALDGKAVKLSQPILIYNNSSYVPLKTFSELLGVETRWENETFTIHLSRPSGSLSGGSGPKTGSASSSNMKDSIMLDSLLRYKFIYQGQEYGVLANIYENELYLRVSDIRRMNVNLSGAKLSDEPLLGDPYVHISELEYRWGDERPLTDIKDEIIVEDETDQDKIDTLIKTRKSALSARKVPSEIDTYTILTQNENKDFTIYTVRLRENKSSDTGYSASNLKSERIKNPINDDEDDEDEEEEEEEEND